MRTLKLAGGKYGLPEVAGTGIGYTLLRNVATIYRKDHPGPRQLLTSEILEFVENTGKILASVEGNMAIYDACLVPLEGAPPVEYMFRAIEHEEMIKLNKLLGEFIAPLLEKHMLSYLPSVFEDGELVQQIISYDPTEVEAAA